MIETYINSGKITKIIFCIFVVPIFFALMFTIPAYAEFHEHTGSNGVDEDIFSQNGLNKQQFCNNNGKINNVQPLSIDLNGVTLDEINAGSKETKYEHNHFEARVGDQLITDDDTEIKGRGNSTWLAPKKPYQIKFKDKIDLYGLGASKKWVLLANYYDSTNLHNEESFYISNMLNMKYNWSGQFVDFWVDGKYIGLYYLTHKVEIGKATVDLGKQGTIVEMDGFPPDDIYFLSKHENRQLILSDTKVDDDHAQESLDSFHDAYDKFEDANFNKDWEKLQATCDVDSFAEYLLVSELTKNGDAYSNSFYFYRNDYDDVVHCGPVWDYDHSFGIYPFGKYTNNPYCELTYSRGGSQLLVNMLDIPEFRKIVEDKYKKYILNNHQELLDRITNYCNCIKSNAVLDATKWAKKDFNVSVSEMIDWFSNHLKYLDTLFGKHENVKDGYYKIRSDSGISKIVYIETLNDGFVRIIEPQVNNVLSIRGDGITLGSSINYTNWINDRSQEWLLSRFDNKFYIISKGTGFMYDISNGGKLAEMNNSSTQLFSLESVPYDGPVANAAQTGDGQITLKWDIIDQASKYAVAEYKNGKYITYTDTLTNNEYSISNLANGVEHQFLVQAYVNGSWSIYCLGNHVKFTPIGTMKPPNVKSTTFGYDVDLSWDSVPGATKYAIAVKLLDGSYYTYTYNCYNCQYTIKNLEDSSVYQFLIQAGFDDGRWSQFNDDDLIKVNVATIKPKVTCSVGNGYADLTWNPVDGADRYAIAIYDNNQFYTYTYDCIDCHFLVNNLVNNKQYYFLVQSHVNNYWSTFVKNDLVIAKPVGPIKPVINSISSIGNTINLSWNNVSGAKYYAIATQNDDGSFTTYSYTCKDNFYTIYNLQDLKEYKCLVQANIDGNWSSYSSLDLRSIKTKISRPSPNVESGDGWVKLSWNKIDNATSYAIAEKRDNIGYVTFTTTCENDYYLIDDVPNNYRHDYLVQALVNGHWSLYDNTNLVSAYPEGTIKPNVTSAIATDTAIQLNWNRVPGATCYAVAILNNDGTFTTYTLDCTDTTYTIKGLKSNTNYICLVQAKIYDKWSAFNSKDFYSITTKNNLYVSKNTFIK